MSNRDGLTYYLYSPSALSVALYPNTTLLMISHFESTHPPYMLYASLSALFFRMHFMPFGSTRRPCAPAGIPPNSSPRVSYHQPPRQPQFHSKLLSLSK